MNFSTEQEAADFIERFAAGLLQTKRAERSNSARAKFFGILHKLVCEQREVIGARCAEFALDILRPISPFTASDVRFRTACRRALECIPRTPEIAQALKNLLLEASFEADLEKVARALDEQNVEAKFENAFRELLCEARRSLDRRERIRRGIDRATARR